MVGGDADGEVRADGEGDGVTEGDGLDVAVLGPTAGATAATCLLLAVGGARAPPTARTTSAPSMSRPPCFRLAIRMDRTPPLAIAMIPTTTAAMPTSPMKPTSAPIVDY